MNLLQKLSLADSSGNLSLTNLSLYIAMGLCVHATITNTLSTEELVMFAGIILNYTHKRHELGKKLIESHKQEAEEASQLLTELKTELSDLQNRNLPTQLDQLESKLNNLEISMNLQRKSK